MNAQINFSQPFFLTVAVPNKDAENLIMLLGKLVTDSRINAVAPTMTDITMLCRNGMKDAAKAYEIITFNS